MTAADEQVALVTGASRGIGRAIAEQLSAAGYAVVINHRDSADDAGALARRLERGMVVQADVADPVAVRAMAARVMATYGRLDVLVNNAGATMPGDWRTLAPETWRRCIDVNLTSVFNCIQVFAPMLARTGRGRVVNIGSTYAGMGVGVIAGYAAAKAGVIALTTSFARELAPQVAVNLIAPGNIDTEMTRSVGDEFVQSVIDRTPLRRLGDPADIAALVRFLVSENAAFITGQTIVSDGGHALG
ncbi:SDR family NAD(P)-dependent oxidoreductase [Kutzneria buriramensis]|uniref:3-oxoacyl-[acyl-carrier protein] reductase n=1 Tax=Kutzneria buriramensis TaxID=1045776 RepID=A0A3E0G5L0_9PSEU|nr:SDR family oxidoreductase [Kutzneria buriramensis]REH18151.1 3-oxoacyl-[acyl-carrier protein] reductase [Kutzneria buriramensis]